MKFERFTTREEAQDCARRLSDVTNGNPYRTGTYRYTVQELD